MAVSVQRELGDFRSVGVDPKASHVVRIHLQPLGNG